MNFGTPISFEKHNLLLSIKPAQFIQNKSYINNLSQFLIQSITEKEDCYTAEYILTEIITNAVKYSCSPNESEITIKIFNDNGTIYFDVSNVITNETAISFTNYLSITYNSDIKRLLFDRINMLSTTINEHVDKVGIGVYMLLEDYKLPLNFVINKCDSNYIVNTKFILEESKL